MIELSNVDLRCLNIGARCFLHKEEKDSYVLWLKRNADAFSVEVGGLSANASSIEDLLKIIEDDLLPQVRAKQALDKLRGKKLAISRHLEIWHLLVIDDNKIQETGITGATRKELEQKIQEIQCIS